MLQQKRKTKSSCVHASISKLTHHHFHTSTGQSPPVCQKTNNLFNGSTPKTALSAFRHAQNDPSIALQHPCYCPIYHTLGLLPLPTPRKEIPSHNKENRTIVKAQSMEWKVYSLINLLEVQQINL